MQCPTSNETYAQNWVRLYAGQEHWARLDEETYALNRGVLRLYARWEHWAQLDDDADVPEVELCTE